VDQGDHIPNPRQSQGIDDKRFAPKRQRASTPRLQNVVHRGNTRPPVILLKVPRANENPQHFDFGRRPIEGDWRVTTTRPAPAPKTLGFQQVKLGA